MPMMHRAAGEKLGRKEGLVLSSTMKVRRSPALALLLALAFGAPTARAAEKKKTKAKVQKVTAGGPTLKYEQFRKQVELKVAEKREEQISGLQRLLELGPKEAEVPDIKFRLAELFFEKSRFYFFRAQETDDKAEKSKTPSERDGLKAEAKKHTRESKSWSGRAVEIYKEIRDKYPKYERMPEVLFALGQSYWNDGQFQAAIEVYADLIRTYKDSPLVAEAWIAFGEYYFNEGDVHKALKSYEKAAADKRSRVYGFALYKQAWCYYNLSDWDKALKKFRATVFYSQLANELSGENRIALGREAQKDFVRTYSHVGDAGRAKFVFADLVGKDDCKDQECFKLLEQLADLWFTEGYFDESASIYRQLIQLDSTNTRNPFFQGRIVDLVARSPDKRKTLSETRRLVEVYEATKAMVMARPAGGDPQANEKAKEDVKEAAVLAESTIRKLAQVWNREAKKTRDTKTYEFARDMYRDYLRLFPSSKFAYEMRFQLGDLFYKLENFNDAAREYEATVKADPKGQYLIEAANDNILSLEELLKDLNIPRPKPSDKPQTIHPEKVRLVEACDRYVALVPLEKADKLVTVKFKAGKIHYDHSAFEEANKRFEDIVTNHPTAKEAEFAANLVVDVYNLRQDWERLYDTSTRYLKIEPLYADRPNLAKDLRRFSEYAKFKLVQILEEKVTKEGGDLRKIARAYQEFRDEFPESENADKALYNASVAFAKVGDHDTADMLRKKLLKEYKSSPLCIDVAFHIAKSYEEKTQFTQAAKLFLEFAENYPNDPRSRDAMYNAAVFIAGVGDVRAANKLREDYLKKFGRVKEGEREAADIYFSIATDLDRAQKWSDAVNSYAAFSKRFPNDERVWDALWHEARIRRTKLHQNTPAEKVEATLLGTYAARKKKGVDLPAKAASYASQIAFGRLEKDFAEYKRLRVATPDMQNPKKFQRSLEDKARARERVVKLYTEIVTKYQQAASTIAALYRIAEAWDAFAKALLDVPCPRGVPADVCGLIRQGIEEKAGPAKDAAFAAYKTCVGKSNELNTFTPHSTSCVKALEVLAPDAFPAIVERQAEYARPGRLDSLQSNSLILNANAYVGGDQVQAANGSPDGT